MIVTERSVISHVPGDRACAWSSVLYVFAEAETRTVTAGRLLKKGRPRREGGSAVGRWLSDHLDTSMGQFRRPPRHPGLACARAR